MHHTAAALSLLVLLLSSAVVAADFPARSLRRAIGMENPYGIGASSAFTGANVPEGRVKFMYWFDTEIIDDSGFMYGGSGEMGYTSFSDLWTFNVTREQWRLLDGIGSLRNEFPVYGDGTHIQFVEGIRPGGAYGGASFTIYVTAGAIDPFDRVNMNCFFGGKGVELNPIWYQKDLDAAWCFDPANLSPEQTSVQWMQLTGEQRHPAYSIIPPSTDPITPGAAQTPIVWQDVPEIAVYLLGSYGAYGSDILLWRLPLVNPVAGRFVWEYLHDDTNPSKLPMTLTYSVDNWPATNSASASYYHRERRLLYKFGAAFSSAQDFELYSMDREQWRGVAQHGSENPTAVGLTANVFLQVNTSVVFSQKYGVRAFTSVAYDPSTDCLLVVGGTHAYVSTAFNDIWAIKLTGMETDGAELIEYAYLLGNTTFEDSVDAPYQEIYSAPVLAAGVAFSADNNFGSRTGVGLFFNPATSAMYIFGGAPYESIGYMNIDRTNPMMFAVYNDMWVYEPVHSTCSATVALPEEEEYDAGSVTCSASRMSCEVPCRAGAAPESGIAGVALCVNGAWTLSGCEEIEDDDDAEAATLDALVQESWFLLLLILTTVVLIAAVALPFILFCGKSGHENSTGDMSVQDGGSASTLSVLPSAVSSTSGVSVLSTVSSTTDSVSSTSTS